MRWWGLIAINADGSWGPTIAEGAALLELAQGRAVIPLDAVPLVA